MSVPGFIANPTYSALPMYHTQDHASPHEPNKRRSWLKNSVYAPTLPQSPSTHTRNGQLPLPGLNGIEQVQSGFVLPHGLERAGSLARVHGHCQGRPHDAGGGHHQAGGGVGGRQQQGGDCCHRWGRRWRRLEGTAERQCDARPPYKLFCQKNSFSRIKSRRRFTSVNGSGGGWRRWWKR